MTRPKIEVLLSELTKEIKKAEDIANKTKVEAQEIAKAAATSPSQSGDREHSKNQSYIAQDYLNELEGIRSMVLEEVKKDVPTTIEGICFIKISYDDGREGEFYLIKTPFKVDGIKFISESSPLGQQILGKRAGYHFGLQNSTISGIIKEIS